jgi:hypothetical protein
MSSIRFLVLALALAALAASPAFAAGHCRQNFNGACLRSGASCGLPKAPRACLTVHLHHAKPPFGCVCAPSGH